MASNNKQGSLESGSATLNQSLSPVSKWSYQHREDKMSVGVTYYASVESTNSVEFSFPYGGSQHASLTLRKDPKYGKDVMFQIEKGQILCSSYDGCSVLVRFDDESAVNYSASPAGDSSSETLFIRNYGKFLEKVRKAKRVRISPVVYQEGQPIFEFDIQGFDESQYIPKK